MRNAIALVLLFILGFSTAGVCQDEPLLPEWTFDDEDEIENWGGMNQLGPLEIDDVKDKKGDTRSILRTLSLGTDPYVFPGSSINAWGGFDPDIEPFDGGEYDTIYIGVRANVSSTWQIYYITKEEGAYAETQRQNFQVNASDDFQDLEFVMERGGWQERTVTGFRLDPGTIANVEAEIDYLSLRGIPEGSGPEAVAYNEKLAITWGAVKR